MKFRTLNLVVGIMVTASHNPSGDNGVKIIDPSGHMLDTTWESFATALVNANDEEFMEVAMTLEKSEMGKVGLSETTVPDKAKVICGTDTRDSSPWLMRVITQGVEYGRCRKIEEFGRLIWPVPHRN